MTLDRKLPESFTMLESYSVDLCRDFVKEDLKRVPDRYKVFDSDSKMDPAVNPWQRMVVGILSCAASHKRLANYLSIFDEVFDELGLDYYVILADPNMISDDGQDFILFPESRLFIATAKDSYESLAHKLAIFYSFVFHQTDYDHVIKCDDGCLLDLSGAIQNLEADYCGSVIQPTLNTIHFDKCTEASYNTTELDFGHRFDQILGESDRERFKSLYQIQYAAGGCGYRVSRKALGLIDTYKDHVLSLGLSYEDVLFGQILFLEGVLVTGRDMGRYQFICPD